MRTTPIFTREGMASISGTDKQVHQTCWILDGCIRSWRLNSTRYYRCRGGAAIKFRSNDISPCGQGKENKCQLLHIDRLLSSNFTTSTRRYQMAQVRIILSTATPNSLYAKLLDIAYNFTFRRRGTGSPRRRTHAVIVCIPEAHDPLYEHGTWRKSSWDRDIRATKDHVSAPCQLLCSSYHKDVGHLWSKEALCDDWVD